MSEQNGKKVLMLARAQAASRTSGDLLGDERMKNAALSGLLARLAGICGIETAGGLVPACERFCDMHRAAKQVGHDDEFEKIFPKMKEFRKEGPAAAG